MSRRTPCLLSLRPGAWYPTQAVQKRLDYCELRTEIPTCHVLFHSRVQAGPWLHRVGYALLHLPCKQSRQARERASPTRRPMCITPTADTVFTLQKHQEAVPIVQPSLDPPIHYPLSATEKPFSFSRRRVSHPTLTVSCSDPEINPLFPKKIQKPETSLFSYFVPSPTLLPLPRSAHLI